MAIPTGGNKKYHQSKYMQANQETAMSSNRYCLRLTSPCQLPLC